MYLSFKSPRNDNTLHYVADDRLLTSKEYKEFAALMEEHEHQQHMENIATLLAAQTIKLEQQRVYIKVLEQLEADRRSKLAKLEETLEQLELEIMRLR
jgi:hypothetical protein